MQRKTLHPPTAGHCIDRIGRPVFSIRFQGLVAPEPVFSKARSTPPGFVILRLPAHLSGETRGKTAVGKGLRSCHAGRIQNRHQIRYSGFTPSTANPLRKGAQGVRRNWRRTAIGKRSLDRFHHAATPNCA